jgi:hypothetical protein
MSRWSVTPISILLGLSCSGCSADSTAPNAGVALIPLAVGAKWEYEFRDSVEIGPPAVLFPNPTRLTVTVTRDTLIAGTRWFDVQNGRDLLDSDIGALMLRSTEGGTMRRFESFLGQPAGQALAFPYPVTRGLRSGGLEVMNPDTTVVVPAGQFQAIRYDRFNFDRSNAETYLVAPGVGVLARIYPFSTISGAQVFVRKRLTLKLVRYTAPQ